MRSFGSNNTFLKRKPTMAQSLPIVDATKVLQAVEGMSYEKQTEYLNQTSLWRADGVYSISNVQRNQVTAHEKEVGDPNEEKLASLTQMVNSPEFFSVLEVVAQVVLGDGAVLTNDDGTEIEDLQFQELFRSNVSETIIGIIQYIDLLGFIPLITWEDADTGLEHFMIASLRRYDYHLFRNVVTSQPMLIARRKGGSFDLRVKFHTTSTPEHPSFSETRASRLLADYQLLETMRDNYKTGLLNPFVVAVMPHKDAKTGQTATINMMTTNPNSTPDPNQDVQFGKVPNALTAHHDHQEGVGNMTVLQLREGFQFAPSTSVRRNEVTHAQLLEQSRNFKITVAEMHGLPEHSVINKGSGTGQAVQAMQENLTRAAQRLMETIRLVLQFAVFHTYRGRVENEAVRQAMAQERILYLEQRVNELKRIKAVNETDSDTATRMMLKSNEEYAIRRKIEISDSQLDQLIASKLPKVQLKPRINASLDELIKYRREDLLDREHTHALAMRRIGVVTAMPGVGQFASSSSSSSSEGQVQEKEMEDDGDVE